MPKFKVGDTVKYVTDYAKLICDKPRKIVNIGDYYEFEDLGSVKTHFADEVGNTFELELVTPAKKENKEMRNKSWTFRASVPDCEVDLEEIGKDLNRANPIALIEVDGENRSTVSCLIHPSLLVKALVINDLCPFDPLEAPRALTIVHFNHKSELTPFMAWARRVKAAQWPTEYKNKATVKVSLIKV